jgi:hypothetical protein
MDLFDTTLQVHVPSVYLTLFFWIYLVTEEIIEDIEFVDLFISEYQNAKNYQREQRKKLPEGYG